MVCRFPLWLGDEAASVAWFDTLISYGMYPKLVLDRNSFKESEWRNASYRARCRYWAKLFPHAPMVEAGNEPDGTGFESSKQTKARYRKLCAEARLAWQHTQVYAGGCVRIAFDYYDVINDLGLDGACFHPYTKTADNIAELVDAIRQHTSLELHASEFGFPVGWWDEHDTAVQLTNLLIELWKLDIKSASYFPYSPTMHVDFYALLKPVDDAESLDVTELYAAMRDAAPNLLPLPPQDIPEPEPPQTVPDDPWADYTPKLDYVQGFDAGTFPRTPQGCVLHGSRSGVPSKTVHQEYEGTVSWAANNPDHLGWNATGGEDEVAEHMALSQWGHHARAASDDYLSYEFAQPVTREITDPQVRTFGWWWKFRVEKEHPTIPRTFITHSEAEVWGLTGRIDGKSDVFPFGDMRADQLRERIMVELRYWDSLGF